MYIIALSGAMPITIRRIKWVLAAATLKECATDVKNVLFVLKSTDILYFYFVFWFYGLMWSILWILLCKRHYINENYLSPDLS